ncbi:MAG TPA: hypothetical protein VMZ91_10055 [Candidatus Paceibacterota bacterium]|nr:hypothetical protein [Candidatus Paceibacterota bacterium]
MNSYQKKKLLNCLAKMYLSDWDADRAYLKVLRILNRLKYRGIYIEMKKIQEVAYGIKEGK